MEQARWVRPVSILLLFVLAAGAQRAPTPVSPHDAAPRRFTAAPRADEHAEGGGQGQAKAARVGAGRGGPGIGECREPATLISLVQGSGGVSPLAGRRVVLEGVVVGDFQPGDGDEFGTDLGGFFIQEEEDDWDEDEATSEGVFVHAPDAGNVHEGELLRIAGRVAERFGLTQVEEVTEILACGTAPLPPPREVTLPLPSADHLERYEGMLVRFPQELVISEHHDFGRFGEIVLALPPIGLDRPYQPTSYLDPSGAARAVGAQELSRITLDDARNSQNPHPARHPNGAEFTLTNGFRGGDTLTNTVGVLDYRFGRYRVQPTAPAAYTRRNDRPATPSDVGGSLRVATFNVLNYFTTLGGRGARTPEEFARQRAKIVAALVAIDADIVGLIEVETASAALADLVDGLNAELGAGTYSFVDAGPLGPDEIMVALAYKPATVTPVGSHTVLDTPAFLDPNRTGAPKNRAALAQTFDLEHGGGRLTVVVNHLKSKDSPCGAGDDDPAQGNCNRTRTLAAELLLDWLATDPTKSGDPDLLLLGDFNAYDEEDPIRRLLAGFDGIPGTEDDLIDLLESFEGEFAYTYVFDGRLGHLDYALATPALARQATGATAWHINADEPDLLDYTMSYKPAEQHRALFEPSPYRSSDHDPVIVGFDLDPLDPD